MRYLFVLLQLFVVSLSMAQNDITHIKPEIESYKCNMNYVESLSKKADFYSSINNYEEAIRIIEEKLAIIEILKGKDCIEYAVGQTELAHYVASIGDFKRSLDLYLNALAKTENNEGEMSPLYALITDRISLYYALLHDYDNALEYRVKATSLFKELYGTEHEWYISSKARLANIYSQVSRVSEALSIQEEILDYWKSVGDSLEYKKLLLDASKSYSKIGNYKKAIELREEANSYLENTLGENDLFYRASLIILSNDYIESGDFPKAYKVCEKHVSLCKKYCGENSTDYMQALSNYAFCLYKGGNYRKALEMEEGVLSMQANSISTDSLDYATTLSTLATFNNEMGYFKKALDYILQSITILQNHPNTSAYRNAMSILTSCYLSLDDYNKAFDITNRVLDSFQNKMKDAEYFGWLSNLAKCYYYINQYDNAIQLYEIVLENQSIILGEKNIDYVSTLEDLSNCYAGKKRLRDAIKVQEKCVEILKDIWGVNNTKYASSLLSLGYLYRCVGDDKKSVESQEKALEILKDDTESGIRFVNALQSLFWGYIYNNPKHALVIAKEAKEILEKFDQQITTTTIRCLQNIALAYTYLEQYKEAQVIYDVDFEKPEMRNYFLKNQDEYVNFLNKKSELYTKLNKYDESLEIEKKALELCKKMDNSDFTRWGIYINMYVNYILLNDINNAAHLMKEQDFLKDLRGKVYFNINSLTSKNRASYWNKLSGPFTQSLPAIAVTSKDSTLISMTYDMSALFAKSILLREDLKLSNAINKSLDSNLQDAFKQYQANLAFLNKGKLDIVRSDSLLKLVEAQEDEIKQKVAKLNMDSIIFVSWKDVQKCLRNDDLAIEFLSIKLDNGQEAYVALALRNDYVSPHLYSLCFKEEIDSVLLEKQYSNKLYKLIWEPLEKEMGAVNTIYFSPVGELYNIGIEYLIDENEECLFNKFNTYRLSSTQELLVTETFQNKNYNKAVLYGGLVYDIPSSVLYPEIEKLNCPYGGNSNYSRGILRDSLSSRGNFEPLYGTVHEIEAIKKIMTDNSIHCQVYEGTYGTEESLKSLPNSVGILHIATHGMYIRPNQKEIASVRIPAIAVHQFR